MQTKLLALALLASLVVATYAEKPEQVRENDDFSSLRTRKMLDCGPTGCEGALRTLNKYVPIVVTKPVVTHGKGWGKHGKGWGKHGKGWGGKHGKRVVVKYG